MYYSGGGAEPLPAADTPELHFALEVVHACFLCLYALRGPGSSGGVPIEGNMLRPSMQGSYYIQIEIA